MPTRLPRLLLLSACLGAGAAAAQDDITVYRCTDPGGHLTLQDSPCGKEQAQQTRRMLQPEDPPPRPVAPAPAEIPEAPAPAPVVVLHAPRPMYECVRPDGSRYTSDDGDGNPRWVSGGWGYVGPARWQPRRGAATAVSGRRGETAAPARDAPAAPARPVIHFRDATPEPPPPRPRPPRDDAGLGWSYGSDGGWVRDDCQPLPQREVCARLRERREDIRDRAFNAQANERATLSREERGISARLAEDCGGR